MEGHRPTSSPKHLKCVQLPISLQILYNKCTGRRTMVCSILIISLRVAIRATRELEDTCPWSKKLVNRPIRVHVTTKPSNKLCQNFFANIGFWIWLVLLKLLFIVCLWIVLLEWNHRRGDSCWLKKKKTRAKWVSRITRRLYTAKYNHSGGRLRNGDANQCSCTPAARWGNPP